jgi:serine/threonine-protein kinase
MEAGELYEKAAALAPGDWIPISWLGVFYYRSARYAEALDAWQRALTLTPDNILVLRNLGPGYFATGQYAEAAATFQRALELDQTIVSTWANLGTARYFLGQYGDAAAALEKAVELAPNNYLYWGNLGDAYRWTPGVGYKAADVYRTAIRLANEKLTRNQNDTGLRGSLALYLAKSGDTASALDQVAQIERTPAEISPGTRFKIAVVLEIARKRTDALDALSQVIKNGYARAEVDNEPELAGLRADSRYKDLAGGAPQ